jgi:hypothetical protein
MGIFQLAVFCCGKQAETLEDNYVDLDTFPFTKTMLYPVMPPLQSPS